MRDGNGDHFQSDPMKSPLFECFLRLHQLNFICNRIPEEYQKLVQEESQDQQSEKPTEIKEETDSEDSFLSADMSSDDNVMTGQRIVEETQISEMAIDVKGTE